jgi:hypothetical protein
MTDKLWAVHIQASDDIVAAQDESDAIFTCKLINYYSEAFHAKNAVVILWPFDAPSHAQSLIEQEKVAA